MKKLTVGILAHVDSGKTTLSEALLYLSGTIRKLGRVDKRDSFLDSFSLERERGITIFSKQAVIDFNDTEITLIDTPGHADFSPEAERTLQILDAAILVISAPDGIQSHAQTLWKLLASHNIPVFIFVNKTDLQNTGRDVLCADMRRYFSGSCLDEHFLDVGEELSMCSEKLMEKFFETGEVTDDDISDAIMSRKLFPCYFGSALKTDGVENLLSGIVKYARPSNYNEKFGARVFKVTHSERGERLVHLKVTGGVLSVKDKLSGGNPGEEWEEKVEQIRIYSGTKHTSVASAEAGTVCAVTGLSKANCFDVFGFENDVKAPVIEPVLSYKVELPVGINVYTALSYFKKIEEEEPTLRVNFNEQLREINILTMGEVQLEVLKFLIKDRFGLNIGFSHGNIVYRETIADTVEGVGHFEPLRHYSEVHLLLEPRERGSGLKFESDCTENELARNWQRLILTHLAEKKHKGVLTGSPITDIKITLVAGKAHKKHTEGGDFRESTYRAVRHGLMKAKSLLLEPWYSFEIRLPGENIGKCMTDLECMGGKFNPPEISESGDALIIGSAPVAKIRDYSLELTSFTHGKGTISYSFKGYQPCHNTSEVVERIGYIPESDLYNTADSVFCEGGSGFVVNWRDVEKYMHIESVLKQSEPALNEERTYAQRAEDYIKRATTDKELLEIFERTYGPIKRRESGGPVFNPSVISVKNAPQASPQKQKAKPPLLSGKEYLLVDGYNIIFAWDELAKAAKESLDSARNQFIHRLCNYQGFTGLEIILVFDAYRVKKNPGTVEKHRNINVVYTKEAESADTYIERVSHELSKNHRVSVATSDGYEQMIILGNGALRIPAAAFHKQLKDTEEAIRNIIDN